MLPHCLEKLCLSIRFQSVQCEQTGSVFFLSQNDNDPGIFWTIDSHVVHAALAMAGAPIPKVWIKVTV